MSGTQFRVPNGDLQFCCAESGWHHCKVHVGILLHAVCYAVPDCMCRSQSIQALEQRNACSADDVEAVLLWREPMQTSKLFLGGMYILICLRQLVLGQRNVCSPLYLVCLTVLAAAVTPKTVCSCPENAGTTASCGMCGHQFHQVLHHPLWAAGHDQPCAAI